MGFETKKDQGSISVVPLYFTWICFYAISYSVDSSPNRNTNESYYQKKINLRQLMKAIMLRVLEGHLSHGTQIESAHDSLPHGDIILTLHKWLAM